jgi:hypothetical protein
MCVVRTSFQKIYNTKREGRNREKKQVVSEGFILFYFRQKKNNQKHKKKQEKEKGEKENSVTRIRAPSCFYLNNRIPSKKLLPGALYQRQQPLPISIYNPPPATNLFFSDSNFSRNYSPSTTSNAQLRKQQQYFYTYTTPNQPNLKSKPRYSKLIN